MQHPHYATPDVPRGISLLVVIIISSLMLAVALALGGFALRTLKNSQTRSDAVQGLYSAESAFACVKYWLGRDFENFTNSVNADHDGDISCDENITTYSFRDDDLTNGVYSVANGLGTATFAIDGTRVEVERNLATSVGGRFDGEVRVYGRSTGGGEKLAERYQRYTLRVISEADFMFVVDRSGSIDGNRDTGNGPFDGEWDLLASALADGVAYLTERIPQPRIGAVSFGLGVTDMGHELDDGNCALEGMLEPNCLREPDAPLIEPANDVSGTLPDNGGNDDDKLGDVKKGDQDFTNYTNLSLGIAMAGLEFLGKHYPAGDQAGAPGYSAGSFEEDVATNGSITLGDYVDTPRGYDPATPKYMIIITDGEPNVLISFASGNYDVAEVDGDNIFLPFDLGPPITYESQLFEPGMPKLFRTRGPGGGKLLVSGQYEYCNDGLITQPTDPGIDLLSNEDYRVAMCNAKQVRDVFVDQGIEIAVIGVGIHPLGGPDVASLEIEDWLRDDIATDERLFRVAVSYEDVYDALNEIIEEIALQESR